MGAARVVVPLGPRKLEAEVWTINPIENLTIYFVHQPEFYFREGLYNEGGVDYPDNVERFVFLSKAVVHLARYLPWQPEVMHVHDWQVGLALKSQFRGFCDIASTPSH